MSEPTNSTSEAADKVQGSLLQHATISIQESEKRYNGTLNLREHYIVYLIEMLVTDPEMHEKLTKLTTVWRRYTEFEQLHNYLQATYPYVVIPPLPEKRIMFGWQKTLTDTFDPDFIDRRRTGLENFLLRVASHDLLSWDRCFLQFLQQENDWKEGCNKGGGYLQLVEQTLKTITVSVRLRKPDPHFHATKSYSSTLHTNISNVLRLRSKVAERQFTFYKLHTNYGRILSEWSVIEKDALGDALQRMGHYMDSLAASVDAVLEDEELLADQLKEYLFFGGALENVCRHQEMLQLQLENAEEDIALKRAEKERARQGKFGLMAKLFGAVDTDEVRELKMNLLDQQLEQSVGTLNASATQLEDFICKSKREVEQFEKQKNADLKATLTAYAVLQLKTAKKGLQIWNQLKDCL